MSRPDERSLIREAIEGDETAFRLLFRRHSPAMYGVAYRMVGRHRPDAEDAVQEAWLRAVRGLPGFRGDSALQTWLVGIAIKCALEVCRRRRPADVVDAPAPAAPGTVDAIDLRG